MYMYALCKYVGLYKSSILRRRCRSRAGLERIRRMQAPVPAWLGPMKSPSAAATDVISRLSVNK